MWNFAAGNNFRARSKWSDLRRGAESEVHMLNSSSPAALYVHKWHVTLCHNAPPSIKSEECCKWADTASVNQSWRQRRSTRRLLWRTGRCLPRASDPGSQCGALPRWSPSCGSNRYLNVIAGKKIWHRMAVKKGFTSFLLLSLKNQFSA